jgi:hypothetical protein
MARTGVKEKLGDEDSRVSLCKAVEGRRKVDNKR